jgi:outer membrane protein assembly factor BamE (lipoprotein component of BamABCDE complex)
VNLESQLFWVVTFASVLFIYGAFMVFSRWCVNSPAVPDHKLTHLRLGMNKTEVLELLGKPRRERARPKGVDWFYGHRLKRHLLVVHFNEAGRLAQFQHISETHPDYREAV